MRTRVRNNCLTSVEQELRIHREPGFLKRVVLRFADAGNVDVQGRKIDIYRVIYRFIRETIKLVTVRKTAF